MKKIDLNHIHQVCKEAQLSERKRKNYNYHKQSTDPIQRMLNALEPETYIQPHKHADPDKREVFLILKGKVLVVTFKDTGEISDHFILDASIGNLGVEIPQGEWHTVIALEQGSVVYEIKDGPYQPFSDKNFANWAPSEEDNECSNFNNNILNQLGYNIT